MQLSVMREGFHPFVPKQSNPLFPSKVTPRVTGVRCYPPNTQLLGAGSSLAGPLHGATVVTYPRSPGPQNAYF